MRTKLKKCLVLLIAVCTLPLMTSGTVFACSGTTTGTISDKNFINSTAVSLDGVLAPAHDYSQANQLPMTGYFQKSFTVGSDTRTAKIYIPDNAPIRAYFIVITVPDGVNTNDFLVSSGWKQIADKNAEGLFVLEPGAKGWGSYDAEQAYVTAAMNFFQGARNVYFSIFGEHYLVGYGKGAPALEAWAAANPLRVISQVYMDSQGLPTSYLSQFATMEFGGTNGTYGVITFPAGFQKVTYNQVVLPTWYINPDNGTISDSLTYWKNANDVVTTAVRDSEYGSVYKQKANSARWQTSYSGSISKVAVQTKKSETFKNSASDMYSFLSYYTRYENMVAYSNQLSVRANFKNLGIQTKTMMVNGYIREYNVYVPDTAKKLWGDKAPVLFVLPGDSQTDKVFVDATQWWQVAQEKGFVMVTVCEQYNASPIAVSHKDSDIFYKQLKDVICKDYKVDTTRLYMTGQSAGSMLSQSFAVALPDSLAAVASTSGTAFPTDGYITIDMNGSNTYPASNKMIPDYMIYGGGDITKWTGTLWDNINNDLDTWAQYRLNANGFTLSADDQAKGVISGFQNRFTTWTWSKSFSGQNVALVKLSLDAYRSHNCISEEMPMLWDFVRHYSVVADGNGNITRYYSPSGFTVPRDNIKIS